MKRIRIEAKKTGPAIPRRDRYPVLPLDARDPAIMRAKRLLRGASRTPPMAAA